MRVLVLLISTVLASSVSLAQNQVNAPDLVIVGSRWGAARNPRNLPPSDPLVDYQRRTGSTLSSGGGASAQTQPVTAPPINPLSRTAEDKLGLSWVFRNELEASIIVKNMGRKTIKALSWLYTFTDPASQEELLRFQARSKGKIRAGETARLSKRALSSTNIYNREVTDDRPVDERLFKAEKRVRITRIEYTDGSVWQSR